MRSFCSVVCDAMVLGELLHHLGLVRIVLRAEGHVMHGAAAHPARQEAAGAADIDGAADEGIRLVADEGARRGPSRGSRTRRSGSRRSRSPFSTRRRDALQAADGMLRRDAVRPSRRARSRHSAMPTRARLVPCGSLKVSTLCPKRFSTLPCSTPCSMKRCVQ